MNPLTKEGRSIMCRASFKGEMTKEHFYILLTNNLLSMTVQEIIIKWDLNRAFLASKIGMKKGTFNNKLVPKHSTQFSPQELIQLRDIIIQMGVDIDTVEAVNFEDTMKQVFAK